MENLKNINQKILSIDEEIVRLQKREDYYSSFYKKNETINKTIISLRNLKNRLLFEKNLNRELSKVK